MVQHPALVVLAVLGSGCAGPVGDWALAPPPGVFWARAGERYRLTYAAPIDAAPIGTTWRPGALAGSPLAPMDEAPVIIKADDFGAGLSGTAERFLATTHARGAVASLGVITQALVNGADVESYRRLDAADFEVWFHGHRHAWALPAAEFAGVGLDAQAQSFAEGLATLQRVLGLDAETFGAPGNQFDDETPRALAQFPQITTWLFGRDTENILNINRTAELEAGVGRVAEPAVVLGGVATALARDVLAVTLQCHPRRWRDDDLARYAQILAGLVAQGRRFAAPRSLRRWRADADALRIVKESATTYRLEATAAQFDHRLTLRHDAGMPIVDWAE